MPWDWREVDPVTTQLQIWAAHAALHFPLLHDRLSCCRVDRLPVYWVEFDTLGESNSQIIREMRILRSRVCSYAAGACGYYRSKSADSNKPGENGWLQKRGTESGEFSGVWHFQLGGADV